MVLVYVLLEGFSFASLCGDAAISVFSDTLYKCLNRLLLVDGEIGLLEKSKCM